MLRSVLSSLLAITFIPSCTDLAPVDELAGESDADGEGGKGDAADALTFFEVKPDPRNCTLDTPRCGGFLVSRPNRSTTTCPDSTVAAQCYVDQLDLSGTRLASSEAQSYEVRIRNGERMVLRGDIAWISGGPLEDRFKKTGLFATEIWTMGSPSGTATLPPVSADAVMVLVKDSGLRCITAPCPSLLAFRINSNRSTQISYVDLSVSGADEAAIARAHDALWGTDGLIVVGTHIDAEGPGKGRTAESFFIKAAPASGH